MCAIVEKYAAEKATSERNAAIVKGFRSGLTKDLAKQMYPQLRASQIEKLYAESQKPVRSHKGQ